MSYEERFLLRVEKGCLVPADEYVAQRLRDRQYAKGDVLSASLKKPRNPGYHRLAHAFGAIVAENIEDFAKLNAHAVLKRLQWESGVGCDEMGVLVPGVGRTVVRIPQSLSYSSMDEGRFREVFRGLARHVTDTYWNTLTPEQLEEMVEASPLANE